MYEQWRAKDPRNATAPSELQEAYGATIAPIILSRAAKRSNSLREGQTQARPAVSQQFPTTMRPTISVNDLSRDLDGVRLNTSPQDRHPRSRPTEDGARRQWEEQVERERRREEDIRALMAQEEAARRHWDKEEEARRRQREEQRLQADQDRSQQAKNAALSAARQAAGLSADSYAHQATRYRESSIASSVTPSIPRNSPGYDAVPHHPLQDPQLLMNALPESTTPIWQANHTPNITRAQPLYTHTPLIDASFINGTVQYPQLMSAHQRAQGYQPSVMFPSPATSKASSSPLYSALLPHQPQGIQYAPPRSSSLVQPKYSPAPPPPSQHAPQGTSPPNSSYNDYESAPHRHSQRHSQPPQSAPRRQSSNPEGYNISNPLGMRPIDLPVELLDSFLGVARLNTLRKIETCGLLLGKQRGAGFTIVTLLIPEQRGTQDTCTMESEELVVEFSMDRDLLTLGWVRTSH